MDWFNALDRFGCSRLCRRWGAVG
ncbi:hypothetical protein [Roseateles sp. YR242]